MLSFGSQLSIFIHIKSGSHRLTFLFETCEKLNASLTSIVSESHKVLDNSFLSSQPHLTDHVSKLNYQACLDIVTAINTYEDFVIVARELVEANEETYRELLKNWNELDLMSDEIFQKLDGDAVEQIIKNADDLDTDELDTDDLDTDELIFAYDELVLCELLDG